MSEKMLVTQALDERDLLVKKIGDKTQKIQAVDTKKRNEDKTVTARVSPEEFGGAASAAYLFYPRRIRLSSYFAF